MMTGGPDNNAAPSSFGEVDETTRKAALDALGSVLIAARDDAVVQWDQILSGMRQYAPWERLLQKTPQLEEHCRHAIYDTIPHIVDTFLYCLLAELDAKAQSIQVCAIVGDTVVRNVARKSWGLPAEPAGDDGWLARFSKQRFEQPY